MPRWLSRSVIAVLTFALLSVQLGASAVAAGPTSLGRTAWQVYPTPTIVANPAPAGFHGDTREYAAASAIPGANDPGWQPCGPSAPLRSSPYASSLSLCPNANTIGMSVGSRLPDCWNHLDFTLFQSFVSIPANTTITQFSINMQGADDGARVSIINSRYPNGLVISGSYIFLGPSQSTSNLAPYVTVGEVNRVIVTQVDDCAVGNNLGYAAISLNGSVVTVVDNDLSIGTAPDLTVPATSGAGAIVTFTPPAATDEEAGAAVACNPASGSTFPVGVTTVTCTASDADDVNSPVSSSFKVTVTPPPDTDLAIASAPNLSASATSAGGAAVTFTPPSASDEDGAVAVTCDHPSGSTFPVGITTVTCSATDQDDTPSTVSTAFTVTVQDTTAPVISGVPANITAEATGATGAALPYASPTASDLVDGTVPVSCSPASGSAFAIGTTTVTCTSTDAHGNSASASFSVTVQDTTPPNLTVPAPISVDATSPAGATVAFSASASDLVDGTVPVTCSPASGSTFAIGTTTVTCTSTDAHGNSASASFSVTVRGAAAQLQSLNAITCANTGPGNSLCAKTQAASASLSRGSISPACNQLGALLNEIAAQTGKSLTTAQAAQLTAMTNRIRAVIPCR